MLCIYIYIHIKNIVKTYVAIRINESMHRRMDNFFRNEKLNIGLTFILNVCSVDTQGRQVQSSFASTLLGLYKRRQLNMCETTGCKQ